MTNTERAQKWVEDQIELCGRTIRRVPPHLFAIRKALNTQLILDSYKTLPFEDILKILDAVQEGRVVIKPPQSDGKCGKCIHFRPTVGRASGPCESPARLRKGMSIRVCQSRPACKDYHARDWEADS